MELKPESASIISELHSLLIVPYGIETFMYLHCLSKKILLIVPYGIETGERWQLSSYLAELLIVPYGIETRFEIT